MSRLLAALVVSVGAVSMAAAAPILSMDQIPVVVDALHIPDGSWDEDDDWGYSGANIWMDERFVTAPNMSVEFLHMIDVDEDARSAPLTPINANKAILNDSSFFWTDFHIDLIPTQGSLGIFNVTAQPSAAFLNVMTMDNGDGSWSIWWDNFNDSGTGVAIGGSTTLQFHFEVAGDVSFKIRQTPTPEPGSLALLALGGLALRRRAR